MSLNTALLKLLYCRVNFHLKDSSAPTSSDCLTEAWWRAKPCSDFVHFYILVLCLQLSQSVPDSETIQRIRLPSPNMNLRPNQMCHVAGWGVADAGRAVDDLRVVGVSVVDQNVCKRQWSISKWIPRLPANVICAGGYGTLNGFCNVSFFVRFWNFVNTLCIFCYKNMKTFLFYRVILVVLWCATGSLLVLYLLQMNGVWTNAFPMSTQTCPSSFPGSTRFSVTMVVKCNNLTQSFASAHLHCI